MSTPVLWHFTCEHGREAIGEASMVLPIAMFDPKAARLLPWWFEPMAGISWWTDQADGQGSVVTSKPTEAGCERWQYRYRALDVERAIPYGRWARALEPRVRFVLETTPGAMPGTWWVAENAMPARLDPVRVVLDAYAP
jgi:hypothetical protein